MNGNQIRETLHFFEAEYINDLFMVLSNYITPGYTTTKVIESHH